MRKSLIIVLSILALGICLGSDTANAMPMFARKLGVPCTTCHTTIPALNEVGYKFRAAGYRMPEQIGKPQDQKFDMANFFSARIQARYDSQATNQPNGAAVPNVIGGVAGPRTKTNAFSFMEGTLYPLTGSWGKYFGSLAELSFSPEDVWEIENAYVRIVMGNEKNFFTSRIGVFHPWEGFGGSDRPYANGRPLFQTNPISAGGRAVPYVFQPWGLDEVGLEVGGDFDKLSVRAAILGGTLMRWEEEANAFLPFPAQTGPWKGANQAVAALGKPFDSVAHNTPDFSANVTYLLNSNGGGVTVLYYHGNIATPTSCVNSDGTYTKIGQTGTDGLCGVTAASASAPFGTPENTKFDFTNATAFRNNFDRVAFYASYPIGAHFLPMGGFQWGRDTRAPALGGNLNSRGAFAEGVYTVNEHVTTGFRYDYWRPNGDALTPQWAVTPYVNIPLLNGAQVIAEYQHRDFTINATNHRQNDTFQTRLIYIW